MDSSWNLYKMDIDDYLKSWNIFDITVNKLVISLAVKMKLVINLYLKKKTKTLFLLMTEKIT